MLPEAADPQPPPGHDNLLNRRAGGGVGDRYILSLRSRTDYNEAFAAWSRASDRYGACKRGETGDSYCVAPRPMP